ncbi:Transglutaminase family protein [Rhodovastum atsumiense]|uniref:Transglutaminase family protein n=1 Tax=Rhodovastum atsumiense TaxID=504468 RepID=A0A5M6J0Z2_9PROT|nr:transglutaminase family protein [Rhodovastum atsumiense]KAA5614250.1 transglutaminase family protein [Rhodovastum atsumiense]CAH2604700.1 Transglutaminase family protein [Rhodovastum atsumiense]
MSIHVALTHRTSYRYDRAVSLGPQTIRLRPAPHARTPVLSYDLRIEPKPHFLNWQQDPQGNFLARVVFPDKVTRFEVAVDLVADMATINPFDFFLEPEAETWPFTYDAVLDHELAPFRKLDASGPLLAALLAEVPREPQRTVDKLVALNHDLQRRISYIVRMEPGVWTPEETLAAGRGSCRDSAWLLVQVLRHLGFAARFVSGYLIQLVADVKPLDGPEGPTADFTDLHAWTEVYLPGAGWIGLDPTSGLMAGEGHIPLAASPDPQSAAPITGAVEKCEVAFDFDMHLTRVHETPRVTRPYAERQWQDILAMGARVDRALAAGDVRLTFGGEPTFVAASDPDAPEWNTEALGPTKRGYAGRLLRRLVKLWSPGAALQYAQGKHYPGEQLPRWALFSHWRADGEPVWTDPGLLADPDRDRDTATAEDAARFTGLLAERLQVDPAMVIPAHEDVHFFLWREHRLPANVIAEDSRLRDPLERDRMARVFGQGLASPVGSVLPLRRIGTDGGRRWQSGRWFFRGDTLFLVPGDSPVGFRLPLESLPWVDPARIEIPFETDPFAPRAPLPGRQDLALRLRGQAALSGNPFAPVPQDRPVVGQEDPDLVRTALSVESRGGLLHVFMPPLYDVTDWLELAAAVEATAAETGRQVVLEGYVPPSDPRLLHFSVTPDPGVIEVNIHPAASWPEHVERTTQLYEEARQVGLASEKFMLDGRHVGTGGGNHVVMGGNTPEDSPFLRRPDLLKSLLGFWHNHPSLSFLFSGLFIGPTSQHPRIDEARQDALNELEIAFAQISPFRQTPPWLTDRLFRNILTDMTGNTHRTEFCIDKMYDPAGPGGRRGLVEFRAFEMPPHARMSAAQMLLMRAALAAFWQSPYDRQLVRWGTRLHDEFMLPHFVEQDFRGALDELAGLGFALDPAWFAPHLEFRFPRIGDVSVREVELEIRHALEPWHVLGEEGAIGGTVRYVDSSTERLQARVSGWASERYVLACNGRAVPLAHTGVAGEFVGGVRFKAWQPPSALHPVIPAQTPLVFDVWDRWSGRSLGGLTHHVAHPGGRNYETFPVNANEAEARRRARFFPFGHTPGSMPEPLTATGPEHPRTLDLRRFAV